MEGKTIRDERHEALSSMFPALSEIQVVSALRKSGGDAQRASVLLRELGCVAACDELELVETVGDVEMEDEDEDSEDEVSEPNREQHQQQQQHQSRRAVSDDAVLPLLALGFEPAAAAAALRRTESVDDAAMWLLDSADRGRSAAAADAREREAEERARAERASRRAVAAQAPVPAAVVAALGPPAVVAAPGANAGTTFLAARFHQELGELEQCCVCGMSARRGCRACSVCELCSATLARCPALPNGGLHHPHRLALMTDGRIKRSCDLRLADDCCRRECHISWRCIPCDFHACAACVAIVPPPGFDRSGSNGRRTATEPPIFVFYDGTAAESQSASRPRKRVYAKFDANAIAREAASRWDDEEEDAREDIASSISSRRQLGAGVVREPTPPEVAYASDRSRRAARAHKRRRLVGPPSMERPLGRDEALVLADFYAASRDKSAARLATAEALLAESNRLDVAGRRALESALAIADLNLASQLLLGSLRSAGRQRRSTCAVCFGADDDGRLDFACLGAGHALHAACAADLALGGGDCPTCRAPLYFAGLRKAEIEAAKHRLEAETERRSATFSFRVGDAVKIDADPAKCSRIMASPRKGGWYADMNRACGANAVVTASFPDAGLFDVRLFSDGATWRLDKRLLALSASAACSAALASSRPADEHDSTLSFVRECSRRLRAELVAVKRARDSIVNERKANDDTFQAGSSLLLSPADARRGRYIVESLCTSEQLKPRIRSLVENGDLDSAARAVRRDNAASLAEAAAWADATKPGTFRVHRDVWLELRSKPDSAAPRTGYRLNPGTVFAATHDRLDTKGELWLRVGTVLIDSSKQPHTTDGHDARSTSSNGQRHTWAEGDDVLFLHLPDSIGARVVRGRDWTLGDQDGRQSDDDPPPIGEIVGPAGTRGAVRVRWLGPDYAHDYHAGSDGRCDLRYAADSPVDLPKPQGWIRARLAGPATRFAVKRVCRSLRCCACGDDFHREDDDEVAQATISSKCTSTANSNSPPFPSAGQEAILAATLERVKIVAVDKRSKKHCVCTFISCGDDNQNDLDEIFQFRVEDLVPTRALLNSSHVALSSNSEATVEHNGIERTRRELVLALGGDVQKAKLVWTAAKRGRRRQQHSSSSGTTFATCVRGHPMHARCFEGRLIAGAGCPACDEPLWVPPVKKLGSSENDCNNSNRGNSQRGHADGSRTALEPMRRVVKLGENCVFRLVSALSDQQLQRKEVPADGGAQEAGKDESPPIELQLRLQCYWSDTILSESVQSITATAIVENSAVLVSISVDEQPARVVGVVPQADLDALAQVAALVGATIHGNALRPDADVTSPNQVLRMCPVCYSGPLANEECSDLRTHHMQCPGCQTKLPNADTRLAEALAQLSPSIPLGESIPRCHACNTRVNFNGCMQCGKLFASMSWDALPKWDPTAKSRLERAQRDRNEMRALANEVRAEAALLEHESRQYETMPQFNAKNKVEDPSNDDSADKSNIHRFWFDAPVPPTLFPGTTKPLQVSCDENCTLRHLNGDCLVCGLDWGEHSGHSCPDGQRGSWFLDYTEEEDD